MQHRQSCIERDYIFIFELDFLKSRDKLDAPLHGRVRKKVDLMRLLRKSWLGESNVRMSRYVAKRLALAVQSLQITMCQRD